jgi:hypothetical protein
MPAGRALANVCQAWASAKVKTVVKIVVGTALVEWSQKRPGTGVTV